MENNLDFKRARTPEQFELRTNQIIDACGYIFQTQGYEKVNFATISQLSNITRPLIYKYFESNEEILLEVLKKEVDKFIATIQEEFAKMDSTIDDETFAKTWAECTFKSPSLMNLYNLLFTVIERNLKYDKILSFKKKLYESECVSRDIIKRFYPNATDNQISYFLVTQLAFATGLGPMMSLNKDQLNATKEVFKPYITPDVTMFAKGILPWIKELN